MPDRTFSRFVFQNYLRALSIVPEGVDGGTIVISHLIKCRIISLRTIDSAELRQVVQPRLGSFSCHEEGSELRHFTWSSRRRFFQGKISLVGKYLFSCRCSWGYGSCPTGHAGLISFRCGTLSLRSLEFADSIPAALQL